MTVKELKNELENMPNNFIVGYIDSHMYEEITKENLCISKTDKE